MPAQELAGTGQLMVELSARLGLSVCGSLTQNRGGMGGQWERRRCLVKCSWKSSYHLGKGTQNTTSHYTKINNENTLKHLV